MNNFIEDPIILNTLSGPSVKYREFKCRPSHVLIIKISGNSTYRFPDGNIRLNAGKVLFIPAGESYTVQRTSVEESFYALINFDAKTHPQRPTLLTTDDFTKILSMFHEISRAIIINHQNNRYMALSSFYTILSLLSQDNKCEYINSKKIDLIQPALIYIEEHIFDQGLKIDTLSHLCGMSDTYFRKIFTMHIGRTPKKYITEKRLEKAKSIIDEGNYLYLYDVAEKTGFSDSLYFSRIFKQYYGVSPRQIK